MARRGWYALASKVGEVAALRSSLTVWKDITASGCRLLSSQASHAAEEAEDLAGSPEANLAAVDVSYPTYMVWGSNTGVGKTLVSAGLCSAIFRQSADARRRKDLLYLKPVQTGFPTDSDARISLDSRDGACTCSENVRSGEAPDSRARSRCFRGLLRSHRRRKEGCLWTSHSKDLECTPLQRLHLVFVCT
ncbi:hypothetical protein M758_3G095700 [Ceratodon purpureus]|nr:hypothetical protein M758_3G095700 [Ceratodon purpureus]